MIRSTAAVIQRTSESGQGPYQMGDVYACSWIVAGTSSSRGRFLRTASQILQRVAIDDVAMQVAAIRCAASTVITRFRIRSLILSLLAVEKPRHARFI